MPQHSIRSVGRNRKASPVILCVLCGKHSLDVCSLLRMPAEIPAGIHAGVREKCMHAGLRSRRIEDKLRLPVFLQDGIIAVHHDRAVGISVRRDPHPKKQEIGGEQEQSCPTQDQDEAKEDAPESVPQAEWPLAHKATIISLRRCKEAPRTLRYLPFGERPKWVSQTGAAGAVNGRIRQSLYPTLRFAPENALSGNPKTGRPHLTSRTCPRGYQW